MTNLDASKPAKDDTNKPANSVRFFLPKYLTVLIAIPFFPYSRAQLVPFLNGVVALSLALHTLAPNKARTDPAITTNDTAVIIFNLMITFMWTALFVYVAGDYLVDVDSFMSIPAVQFAYPFAWILSDELIFYLVHKFLHKPGIYQACHKMHHKFKTTNAWTSFYSHPADHTFAVLGSGLALPLLMTVGLGIKVAVPVMAFFMGGAITTFIGSHHTTRNGASKESFGTDHLIHHQKFTVNYGNFGYLDKAAGSYRTEESTAKGWLTIPGVGTIL